MVGTARFELATPAARGQESGGEEELLARLAGPGVIYLGVSGGPDASLSSTASFSSGTAPLPIIFDQAN